MTITNQRLRNLTTGRLHTEMGDIYEDLETLTGEKGLMTHMIPNVMRAVEPWLKENVKDERLWDGSFDQSHEGETEIPDPTEEERKEIFKRYSALPHPFE